MTNLAKPVLGGSDLVFRYGPNLALRSVSLEVRAQEILMIVGHNGSSKSTLLRVLAGLSPPLSGTVTVGGGPVAGFSRRKAAALGISYLPQTGGYFPSLTVADNIQVARDAARRLPESWRLDALIDDQLGSFLRQHGNERAQNLSGGQRQLLRVAMSLSQRPQILLFDEPSIGLSPAISQHAFGILRTGVREHGLSCVIAEQNIDLGLKVADRVITMRLGEILAEESAREFERSGISRLMGRERS
jgi:branched-chain amino acid transport system ATP-binding protein